MQRSVYKHIILDTVAATGGDILVKNRYIYVNGVALWKQDDVANGGVVYVASNSSVTPGVLTYDFPNTPLNNTTYTIQVTVSNGGGQGANNNPLVFNISVVTPATGTLTDNDVVDLFEAKINTPAYSDYFTASGTDDLVVTATTAYPVIIGSAVSPATVTQTTPGVTKAGSLAQMAALGVGENGNTVWASGTKGTFAGTYYDLYYCLNYKEIGENNTALVKQANQVCLWIPNGATNASDFVTALDNVLGGFLLDGTTVSEHQLETKSLGGVQ